MHIHELQSHFIPHILKLVEDQFVDANALTDIDFWKRFMKTTIWRLISHGMTYL